MADAKMVFSLVENVDTLLKACLINKRKCPVVAIKSDVRDSIPDGVIDFASIMDPNGKIMLCELQFW